MAEDYCDLCDLPRSTCVHGMPKPPPEPPKPVKATRPAASPVTRRTVAAPRTAAATPAKAAPPRRRTSPEEIAPWILRVLLDADGALPAETVMEQLETHLAETFRPGDHETGPQGELRWRTAARWARKSLADEGLLHAPEPGVWALTDRGRLA